MTVMSTTKPPAQNDLRAAQLALTRSRIIDAALQRFTPWSTDLPFDDIAARAGVSVRTVYRHFPSQRDLLDAVTAHLMEHSGWKPDELDAETLAAATHRSFVYYAGLLAAGNHEREQRSAELDALRAMRLGAIERVVGPETEGLDPELARGVMAVFAGLTRVHFLMSMTEHWGLDGPSAGRAIEWAINALFDDLRRRRETP